MEMSTLFKKIHDSINYGLSNKKNRTGGVLLKMYTYVWVCWTLFFILVSISIMIDEGLLFSIFAFIILILPIFILPPYLLIYYAWSRNTSNAENGNPEKIRKQNETTNVENGTTNVESDVLFDLQNDSKLSNLTQKRTKRIDRVLHGERIIAGISGAFNKNLFGTNADVAGVVVLTPTRVVFYSKKMFGGYHYKDYQIKNILNVTFSSGLLFTNIIFHTNDTDIKVSNISKSEVVDKFVDIVKSCIVSSANHKSIREDDITSDLSISRETEFYQGFIRFKISVTNTSSFVVNDVALDFDYDNNLLRIDRYEPDYQIKNGKVIFGNISANSSKTIAVYFDPMMCSKGADINCQVNYKDAKGQPQTTHMEPKKISVVCPIMETESDINIGRLKEFIEKLPYRDSKVYQVQNGFDIDVLKNISREIIQKHDVKHIRTLFTKDGDTCEIWYYGKTKVHSHDIVIKITILSETQNIELFAATQTVESLAGLLAEVGRELKGAIESKVTGNVQQVINVSIKDSIVQRSNLLSHCDIDGNCSGDVVIEDSLVQRSDVGFGIKADNSVNVPVKTPSTELKEDNLDEINKYGAAALKSVKLLQSDKSKNPTEVWDIVTKEIFGHGTSSQKKGCPKNTFLGLCGEGLIKGVPKGNYTNSKENKKYALKAVEILKKNPHLAFNINALWNEVVDEPKVHNSQMNVVIALWNNDFINNFDVVSIIKKRFVEVGNPAQIPLLKGNESFEAKLSNDGISVDNLGNSPFLPWDVFIESVSLLHENGGQAKRGDAMNSKLGDEKLPLNSIEGHVAHVVYGIQIGDRITIRRITPIACILIWAKICQHKSGELLLSNNYVMMSDQIGENNSEEKKKGERMNLNKHEIHEYLTGIAKEQRKVTYGDVMRECGEEVNGAAIANKLIKQILDPISEENIQNKEPLLTALVVNGKTGIPGPGFFKKWMETYRDYIGPSDGPEAQKAHSEELERVFNYWHDSNENSCPACGEVVPDGAKFCVECGGKIE